MELHFQPERLLEAKLIFGLAVRFFGVFAVLIVLMAILYLTGWFFSRYMTGEKKVRAAASPPPAGEGPSQALPEAAGPSPGIQPATVPGEVAAAIALGIRDSAASVASSGIPVAGEVAAAVALALSGAPGEGALPVVRQAGPAQAAHQESPWKLIGRQEAVSRANPWTGRRTDRETTNRESKV